MLARLADIELDTPKPEFAGAARLAEVEESIARMMASFTAREFSAEVVFPAVAQLEKDRDQLRNQRKRLEAAEAAPDLSSVGPARVGPDGRGPASGGYRDPAGRSPLSLSNAKGKSIRPDRIEFVWHDGAAAEGAA